MCYIMRHNPHAQELGSFLVSAVWQMTSTAATSCIEHSIESAMTGLVSLTGRIRLVKSL